MKTCCCVWDPYSVTWLNLKPSSLHHHACFFPNMVLDIKSKQLHFCLICLSDISYSYIDKNKFIIDFNLNKTTFRLRCFSVYISKSSLINKKFLIPPSLTLQNNAFQITFKISCRDAELSITFHLPPEFDATTNTSLLASWHHRPGLEGCCPGTMLAPSLRCFQLQHTIFSWMDYHQLVIICRSLLTIHSFESEM